MKVALAYSGGLDTTVSIKWLKEKYNAEVITITVDVGQEENFEEIQERSLKSGALEHYFVDAKKKFAEEYVSRCIKANGLYEGAYPLSSALSRPLIAEEVVKIALREGCDTVAHGCTGKGNDQLRFDITFSALAPNLKIIAPVREWNMSRDQEIEYALKHGLPINPKKSRFSIDENLWGRSIEAGELEDPWIEPPWEAFKYLKPLEETPETPKEIVIRFEKGVPVALDGVKMPLEELVMELNKIGGMHGYGYIDHIEDRVVGLKSREVYEAPAALILINAHIDLEKMVLGRRTLEFKKIIEEKWANMVYSGLWVDPLMNALNAFIDETQKEVSGEVRVKLYKGSARIVGRRAEKPLYHEEFITYTSKSLFDQRAGEYFSKLWGLETHLWYMRRGSRR
ncbi:MAG: argininosuccinate synthase [Nitrososphaerota archaeon]|nr:argininosuccinate synthase [Candidatus Geocrenenecus dongiae]